MDEQRRQREKKRRILVYMALMCALVFLVTHPQIILLFGNVLIGILLLVLSFNEIRNLSINIESIISKTIFILFSVVTFVMGIAIIPTIERAFNLKMIAIGCLLIIYGLGTMIGAKFINETS